MTSIPLLGRVDLDRPVHNFTEAMFGADERCKIPKVLKTLAVIKDQILVKRPSIWGSEKRVIPTTFQNL